MPPSSPCSKLCLLDDASGLCQGCGRTVEEISGWSALSEAQRLAIMALLPARRAAGSPVLPKLNLAPVSTEACAKLT